MLRETTFDVGLRSGPQLDERPTPRSIIRTIFSFPAVLGALIVLSVYVVATGGVDDPDLWFHLENAKHLLTYHQLPRVDTFSYTTMGHPWIDHEWLAEVPYYLAWRLFGLVGIHVFYMSVLMLTLLGIFYLAYKHSGNVKGSFLVTWFCVLLAAVSFGPRTLLFGYVYLLIILLVLERFRAKGRAPLWLIPIAFCLWINCHGSWLVGLVVFGIIIGAGLVEGSWGRVEAVRWSPQQLRRLMITFGASVAALFVNPFGYRLVMYPFDMAFKQKLAMSNFEEWASVDFHDARGKVVLLLLVALLLGALLSRHRWQLGELGLALLAVYSGLSHIRFLFLAAILLAPLLTKFLDFIPPYRPEIDKPLLNALIMGGLLLILVARFPTRASLENGVAERFPAAALTYIRTHGLPGRTLNDQFWGGYLAWNEPEIKTFIDSRSDIYEYSGVLQDYLDTIRIKDPLKVLDKYQIRWVMFPPKEPLAYLLRQNQNWKVVYDDHVTEIFERVGPMPSEVSAVTATRQTSESKAY
jgi:hypothetical protein